MHFIILPALLSLVGPHAAEHVVFVLYCFGVGGSGGATFAVLIAVVVEDGGLLGKGWHHMGGHVQHTEMKFRRCAAIFIYFAPLRRPAQGEV